MAKLKAEAVKSALEGLLGPDVRIDVSRYRPSDRITGWIMHPLFHGISHIERQEWLWNGWERGPLPEWKGLRQTFREQSAEIGLILTFSPREYENAFDQSA